MSRLPIRLRVAAAFAISMAVVLAITGWFLYARVDSHLSLALDRQLRLRAQDLAALVREPRASLADASLGGLVDRGESYAQLVDEQGRVVDATPPLERTSLLSRAELGEAAGRTIFRNQSSVPGLDDASRLLATSVRQIGGRRLVLVVGATRQDDADTIAALRNELLIVGPIALALATLAGYLLAGLSLRPVESMRRRAAAISADTPGGRLPVPATRDELERLGETLNEMLARLENALQRERDFVADAGHELRTPLALLRTELELALRHGESVDELRAALRSSVGETDRLAQLAEDLLLLARAEHGEIALRKEGLPVSELLTSVVNRFSWRAEEANRIVMSDLQVELVVVGDRLRLEQALGNLVDNALRHGAGDVILSAASVENGIAIHVTDEGSGIPPSFLPRAFERFSRSDQSRARGGAGLGLSIVMAIAVANGGSAHLVNRETHGVDAWLVLPERSIA